MDSIEFIVGSYVLTFGAIALVAARVLRRGSLLSRRVPDEEKYWL